MPAATATPPLTPASAVAPQSASAFDLATRAYGEAAAGRRRAAAADFAAAVALTPEAPNAAAWRAAQAALTRRWSAGGYVFLRAAGSADPGSVPVLGGGQSGASLAFTPDPLAPRPLALTARATASNSGDSAAEAALGVRWQLTPGLTLSGERLVALSTGGRNAWTARLAAGGSLRRGGVTASAYGEAGVVGTSPVTRYASAQFRAGYPVKIGPALELIPGAGVWSSLEQARTTVDRVDAGPGVRLHWARAPLPVDLQVDYRFRVAGKAAPGSGPAVTLTTGF